EDLETIAKTNPPRKPVRFAKRRHSEYVPTIQNVYSLNLSSDISKFPYLWFCCHPLVFAYHCKHNRDALTEALEYKIMYPWIAKRDANGILDDSKNYTLRETKLIEFLAFFDRIDLIKTIVTHLGPTILLENTRIFKAATSPATIDALLAVYTALEAGDAAIAQCTDAVDAAVQSGRLDLLTHLLDRGFPMSPDVLRIAATSGHTPVLAFLKPRVRVCVGSVRCAAAQGHVDALCVLLPNGARVGATRAALREAVRARKVDVVRYVLARVRDGAMQPPARDEVHELAGKCAGKAESRDGAEIVGLLEELETLCDADYSTRFSRRGTLESNDERASYSEQMFSMFVFTAIFVAQLLSSSGMDIEIFYQLVVSNGDSYKRSSIDRVTVKHNADIIHLRRAVETANSKILTGVVASQLTVYETKKDLLANKLPLDVDFLISGIGQSKDTALFVVVPDDSHQDDTSKQTTELILNRIQRVEELLKTYRSSESSSVQDIETSYEKNARKTVQLKLHATFRIRNFIIKHGKLLEDPEVFQLLHKKRIYGEIDIYLGIVSPDTWKIADISPDFHIVDGKFEDCISSLNSQISMSFKSPTTEEFPDVFNYYCIFEATTSHKATPKLIELEYQIQYIVARQFVRQIKDLTLKDKSKDFIEFIKSKVLGIVHELAGKCAGKAESRDGAEIVGLLEELETLCDASTEE
ncbi:MAG: hypothetical protein SGCHY_004922, partial [Lobulomycetales sp.]